MQQILLILFLTVGSVFITYTIRLLLPAFDSKYEYQRGVISKYLKIAAMFFIEPILMFTSFWGFKVSSISIVSLPFLGIGLMLCVASILFVLINQLKINNNRGAAIFTSGTFSNIPTFGGLTAFILFGGEGYTLILLFSLLTVPVTYFIGYPLSRQISRGESLRAAFSRSALASSPYLAIPFIAFILGSVLNGFRLPMPEFLLAMRSYLIPFNTVILGCAIGLTLRLNTLKHYQKEVALIFAVKFLISPLIIITASLMLGLHTQVNGLPFKIALIASLMPVGFNALIPPAIYGFDLDLANAAWVMSMVAFIAILPIASIFLL